MDDEFYMKLALNRAWDYQLLTYPNPSVGALVLYRGEIVAIEAHTKAGNTHAEPKALLRAYETITKKRSGIDIEDAKSVDGFLRSLPKGFFGECKLYITLEPCSHIGKTPSCAKLIEYLKPKMVIVAHKDPISSHSGGIDILKKSNIETKTDVCTEEAYNLLEPFIIWQKRAFVLFKLAQTLNGKIGGGYISSKESLTDVHKLRSVCDRLVIGGNTVRTDRPKLDCRYTKSKAPDITIYSNQNIFDKDIPLFKIEDREVEVSDRLEDIYKKPSFILVEGGEGMLKALQKSIDWLLLYQAPKLTTNTLSYNIEQKLKFLHHSGVETDIKIWSRFE